VIETSIKAQEKKTKKIGGEATRGHAKGTGHKKELGMFRMKKRPARRPAAGVAPKRQRGTGQPQEERGFV